MSEVEWRDVPGYEGLYLINAEGQVLSAQYKYKLMRVYISKREGAVVNLSNKGHRSPRAVHRLLARAFLGMPHDVNVRHKDGNKLNNDLDNLEFTVKPPKRKLHTLETVDDFFWSKIVWDWSDGCWEWQGPKNNAGYGSFGWNKRTMMAHRFSWLIHYGEIPEGLVVMHKCDNPACVNPYHLQLGTHKDNSQDAKRKGRLRGGRKTGGDGRPRTVNECGDQKCVVCGEVKPIEEFPYSGPRRRSDGYRYRRDLCKPCYSKHTTAKYHQRKAARLNFPAEQEVTT